jgi:hypothetical protein
MTPEFRLESYNLNNISELGYGEDGSLKIYLAGGLPQVAPQSNWLHAPKGKPFTLITG